MDLNAIRKMLAALADLLNEKQLEELEYEEGGVRVRVKRGGAPVAAAAPAPHATPTAAPVPPASQSGMAGPPPDEAGLVTVRSPIVGTFYDSASPGSPEFVRVGDTVTAGQTLCIIEAMKLMNEIEAEVAGQIVRKLVTNGQPVEYGQSLMLMRPS